MISTWLQVEWGIFGYKNSDVQLGEIGGQKGKILNFILAFSWTLLTEFYIFDHFDNLFYLIFDPSAAPKSGYDLVGR